MTATLLRSSRRSRVVSTVVATLLLFAASAGWAQNIVRLTPVSQTVQLTDPNVTLDLEIDFAEVTVGGGVEVTYDATRLQFDSFVFTNDPNFLLMGPAQGETAQPLEIGFGWLVVTPPFGVSGPHTIGTLTFLPIADGTAAVDTGPSASSPGPFFAPGGATPLVVDFQDATVEVVPEPAVGVGLASGIAALVGMKRNRERARRERA